MIYYYYINMKVENIKLQFKCYDKGVFFYDLLIQSFILVFYYLSGQILRREIVFLYYFIKGYVKSFKFR